MIEFNQAHGAGIVILACGTEPCEVLSNLDGWFGWFTDNHSMET